MHRSGLFHRCSLTSEVPIRRGTTYVDSTRMGTFDGEVTEFVRNNAGLATPAIARRQVEEPAGSARRTAVPLRHTGFIAPSRDNHRPRAWSCSMGRPPPANDAGHRSVHAALSKAGHSRRLGERQGHLAGLSVTTRAPWEPRRGPGSCDPQPAGCGTDTAGGCSTRVVGGTLDAKSLTGSACGRATNASHPQEWNSLSAR